jgi:predicted MFS family arabinose efflux permease
VHWESVILSISFIAAAGGMLMLFFVPDGPYLSKGTPFDAKGLAIIFGSKGLRAAAFGYFGHMWELYTFYAFVPLVVAAYAATHPDVNINISFWSFVIIGAGSIGCAGGGIISKRAGSANVAWVSLLCSGLLCLFSSLLFQLPQEIFLGVMIVWGVAVVGDSPQFSALIARYAPKEFVGSALTIGNCIGFAITIVSIQFTSYLSRIIEPEYIFSFLTIGPLVGLMAFKPLIGRITPE